jgi:membrane-associated phospholipid phosphatase
MNLEQDKSGKFRVRVILDDLAVGGSVIIKSRFFYIGLFVLAVGVLLNLASQTYLHNYMAQGKTLPMLADLILDNIPYVNVAFYYDISSLLTILVMVTYIITRNEIKRFPYFLILIGIFYVIRGIFIVLTPFGNPPLFTGSGPLNGFSAFELGVYPSGHVGNALMFFLLARDKFFKWILFALILVIIIALLLARGHYSIDIFSGWFFAYAIKSFGDKHLKRFDLSDNQDHI